MFRREAQRRRGLTLVEAVVLIALGTLLLGLLLPAVAATQNADDRTTAVIRLKNMCKAVHNHAATYERRMPPAVGAINDKHGTIHFHLLPFLQEQAAYNAGKTDFVMSEYFFPGDPSAPEGNKFQGTLPTANFAANYRLFGNGAPLPRLPGSFPAGTSHVVMFTERYQVCNGTPMVWGHDQLYYWAPVFNYYNEGKFQDRPRQRDCDPARAQSFVKEGILVGMGDGSVRTISPNVSVRTWGIACNPRSTDPLPNDWLEAK